MSDQAPASASAEATTTTMGPTEEEKLLVQCKNPKEAIEYELKAKAIVMDALKHLQRGTDPVPGDIDLDSVYAQMVHDLKKLVSLVYSHVSKANRREITKTMTNPDGECIWNPEIIDDNNDEEDDGQQGNVQVQEEACVPAAPDWVDVIQSLDVTLNEHQTDKLCMLLKCHSEMLERQAMCSKMLSELGRMLNPVTFQLILQMVIHPLHQINLPDTYLLVLKQQPNNPRRRSPEKQKLSTV